MGNGAEAAADVEIESALFFAVNDFHLRDAAHVVHVDETAGVTFATGEGDFEFAAEVLGIRVAEEEFHVGLRVRRDVEGFVGADAGVGARGNVADGVSAGFASSDAGRGEAAA